MSNVDGLIAELESTKDSLRALTERKAALSIAESKWKAWPTAIAAFFEDARTVEQTKPSVNFERK